MKIKLNQIIIGQFTVREEIDKEYLKEIKKSMKMDGQWNPIIVRPFEEGYELIAGHTRFQAAKELGWKDLESTVKDLNNEEADFLSLKTNLMRKDMSEIEEGKIIQKMMVKYEKLTQEEIGKGLGKTQSWVNNRLSLVLKVVKEVQAELSAANISAEHVTLIAQINKDKFNDWEDKQREFLKMILDNEWTRDETRKQLKRFFNQTIYTIGYSDKSIDDFIKILAENKIDYIIDIRASDKSKEKPEFNGGVLKRSLSKEGIKYEHYPELGVHFVVQQPYKAGYFKLECLKQWYQWNIDENNELEKKVEHFKDIGKCALMCMEQYAKPLRNQEYHCHRDILTDMILKTEIFSERIDL